TLDDVLESTKTNKIGTTGRGIGPCFSEKCQRTGIRMIDLLDQKTLSKKIKESAKIADIILTKFKIDKVNVSQIVKEYAKYTEILRPFICDTCALVMKSVHGGEKILIEGAQAMYLDVDHGTYPYVTSSNPISSGALTGSGIGPIHVGQIIGVMKAYTSRVGEGPFPTRLNDANGIKIRKLGHEYGTTTGRPRDCGWLDLVLIKNAVFVNGITNLCVNHIDTIGKFKKIKVCVGYKYHGHEIDYVPVDLENCTPIYKDLGGDFDTKHKHSFDELCDNAKAYIKLIETYTGVPVKYIGIGPDENDFIIREIDDEKTHQLIKNESRTFSEYLLIPRRTTKDCTPDKVSLETYLTRYSVRDKSIQPIKLNAPLTSAIMQSVSDDKLAISLAQQGGISFIFASQTIENQCKMVEAVKKKKSGFVQSVSNLKPTDTLSDVLRLKMKNDHSTMPITQDGEPDGKLLGLITSRDYRIGYTPEDTLVTDIMTPIAKLNTGNENISLTEANTIIWDHKLNVLPIINKNNRLISLVFRKDYEEHANNMGELLDDQKRYMVGAGVNTRDYEERIPAIIKAGADVLCIDSSDGFSDWSKDVITYVRENYGNDVKIGAGNIVSAEAFRFLAKAGADFIKIGIGGGSICITREQKSIGLGQASAVIEVTQARDSYFKETGIYIPICSDGGITHDKNVIMALAMGADFIMMGRYFARFEEAPGEKITINGNIMKAYWGEGSNKAMNWQRYDMGGRNELKFEEGVDSYIPYAGKLKDNVQELLSKIKSTMCNCNSINLDDFRKNAIIRPASSQSIIEGGTHDVLVKNGE
ncbi:MAG TPA: IMP dehydrogenase, partial [Candidatus Angelobacter sp.]|nr:IMP dehydrogenase [Candidatus Angelobacter sp.]